MLKNNHVLGNLCWDWLHLSALARTADLTLNLSRFYKRIMKANRNLKFWPGKIENN